MKKIQILMSACLMLGASVMFSQGLEGIVVEKYYQANAADVSDATAEGAIVPLTTGSVTYRVYVDMAAGYKFVQLFGNAAHNLTVSSTANFYNDPNWGVSVDPGTVTTANVRKNTGMIDSYFTTGGTANGKVGVLKSADTDGTIGNAQSILANNPGACFGLPINGASGKDGFAAATAGTYLAPNTLGLGTSVDVLDQTAGNSITIANGSIAALGGVVGPTASNMVLVGQFTVAGSLTFSLNVQIVNIATGLPENYVASSPGAGELTNATLAQTVEPTCPSAGNDDPNGATLVPYSVNSAYPNCQVINATTVGASNSSASAATGNDVWYRFTAQSTAVSIQLTSSAFDDNIELYQKVGANYVLMTGGAENVGSGAGDFERLNYSGLTPGTTYYVSVGAASGTTAGAFQLCIQTLRASGCAYAIPASGFALCSTYKASYTGAASYAFTFTGVGGGASGSTSISGTSGLISLSNSTLGLRYGGIYNVQVNALYNLQNSASTAEPITVSGNVASANCSNVAIQSQPLMEVKTSLRCPTALTRSQWLIASVVGGGSQACGAINYTFEFTQVASCSDGTVVSVLPSTFNTAGSTPYLGLGVLPNLSAAGAWDVRVRPNFTSGAGTYGPTQRILVNGTSASGMLDEEQIADQFERNDQILSSGVVYPNPNSGSEFNVQLNDVTSSTVGLRVMDAMGRVVMNRQFSAEGSLFTTISMDSPLSSGVYIVELKDGATTYTERLIVN